MREQNEVTKCLEIRYEFQEEKKMHVIDLTLPTAIQTACNQIADQLRDTITIKLFICMTCSRCHVPSKYIYFNCIFQKHCVLDSIYPIDIFEMQYFGMEECYSNRKEFSLTFHMGI